MTLGGAIAEGVQHVEVAGTVAVAAGSYPEALELRKRVHLEGAGPLGTELLAVPGQDIMLTLWESGTSVRGFRFQDDGPPREDGIPRIAVLVQGADRCTLAGNVLAGGELDIRVWPIAQDLTDLVITDNSGINTLLVGLPGYYPVRRCRLERNEAMSIQVRYALDLSVAENAVDPSASVFSLPALSVTQSPGCEVRGNTVRSDYLGIEIENCPGGLVLGNRVSGPFYYGINVRCLTDFDAYAIPVRRAEGKTMTLAEENPAGGWSGPKA